MRTVLACPDPADDPRPPTGASWTTADHNSAIVWPVSQAPTTTTTGTRSRRVAVDTKPDR